LRVALDAPVPAASAAASPVEEPEFPEERQAMLEMGAADSDDDYIPPGSPPASFSRVLYCVTSGSL
jgi:hypothetical protein